MQTPTVIAGRYELRERLGAGSAAEVFRATDRQTGDDIALKLLRPRDMEDPSALTQAFYREFRLLTALRHPHLVRVHDFGSDRLEAQGGFVPWFTMDLIAGRPIADVLGSRRSPAHIARAADAVLDALSALHDRGLIHRDVTITNILAAENLDQEPPPVWLMDLGLADRAGDVAAGVVRGTLATIAPETLRGGRIDGRADLYSLGCVMYRLLTGQDPFVSDDPWSLLRAHLGTVPTPPRHLDPSIPASLESFVLRLLEKDPAGRPPTALAAREELSALSGRTLDAGRGLPTQPLAPRLAGRDRELALFHDALEELSRGRGTVLIVRGKAGSGCSRLLAELRLHGRLAGHRSHLVSGSTSPRRPFGWLEQLEADLATGPGRAPALPGREDGPHPAGTRIAATVTALDRQPTVLLVDDADQVDRGSREAIERIAERILDQELSAVLVIASTERDAAGYDTDGPTLAESLLERGGARAIRLLPLDAEAVGRMAASMLGREDLPARWAEAIHQASGGLPLLVEAFVDTLAETGRLTSAAVLEENPEDALAGLEVSSRRSEPYLDTAWNELDEGARRMLAAVAMGGGEPLDFDQLAALDPRTAVSVEPVAALVDSGLVERVHNEWKRLGLRLAAPALAPAILRRCPDELVRTLARRRADQLARDPSRKAERARHLRTCGEHGLALALLLDAASDALAAGLPEDARELCEEVLSTGDSLASRDAARARRLRADAFVQLGRPGDAEREYTRAITAAEQAQELAESAAALRGAGILQRDTGDPDEALRQLEAALAVFDEIGDTSGGATTLCAIGRTLAQMGRTDEARSRLTSGLRQARRSGHGALEADLLVLLGELDLAGGKADDALERFREAEALGVAGVLDAARHGRIRALETSRRSEEALAEVEALLAESRDARHMEAETEALALRGRILRGMGRRGEALATLARAVTSARRLGRVSLAAALTADESAILAERGQYRTALGRLERAQRSMGEERGGRERDALVAVDAGLAACLGQPERVDALTEHLGWGAEDAGGRAAERTCLLGLAAAAAGQFGVARERLQESCFIARRGGLRDLEIRGLLGLADAYLHLREPERSRMALRRLHDLAEPAGHEEAEAIARVLMAELELSDPSGDMETARDEARRAADVLSRRERGDVAWRAWLALHQAATRLGSRELAVEARERALRGVEALASSLPEGARTAWEKQPRVRAALELAGARDPAPGSEAPAVEPASPQLEALERLLEINRALNSTLELDRLLETLVDTAIDLVGAERGFVLLSEEGRTEIEVARGEGGRELAGEDRALSRELAHRVIRDGQPIVSHDARSDDRFSGSESIHALQIQSILAQPLRSRGQVTGALVLDSRQASALFDREDQRLLERLADQAGIAVTNARFIAELKRNAEEIRRLNDKLTEEVEQQRVEILEKQSNLEVRYRYDCMVGASGPMQKLYRAIDKIMPTDIPVLVTGESGTGKDLIARVLHYNGKRAEKRYVTLNCAALTETLLESELFGHRKGAFSGADRDRKGLFEQADGGTLFLDEIGELPLQLQPKLLRALQFGEVRRVGDDTPRHVDVRVIAATNRDPSAMVADGTFREDLFYRLDVARVHIAPLRERMEDIGLLVGHFLELHAQKSGQEPRSIEPAALRLFLRYDWPGNVRELENEVTKLAAFTQSTVVTEVDILENATFLERARRPAAAAVVEGEGTDTSREAARGAAEDGAGVTTLEQAEVEQIRQALRAAGGNRTRAAEMLGIDRSTLYRKIKKLGDPLADG